jgi:predicted kinase
MPVPPNLLARRHHGGPFLLNLVSPSAILLCMKTVTVITGNTGVGKSTVAELLMQSLPESGWYDCDIPWKTNPGFNFDNGRLKQRMIGVAQMCAAAVNVYFESGLQHVVLSGVLPGDLHFNNIREGINADDYRFTAFWLTCEEGVNRERLIGRDGHDKTCVELSEYLTESVAVPVETTSLTAKAVAEQIAGRLHLTND